MSYFRLPLGWQWLALNPIRSVLGGRYSRPTGEATRFNCPNCGAAYQVVRVEAPATHNERLTCLSCGGPLRNRERKFALKYFRTSDGAEPGR